MSGASLRKLARAQEDAARQARRHGFNYLASRHEAVARKLRKDAEKADAQATARAEAS